MLAEAVPCSWQWVSSWWDMGQVGQRMPSPTAKTMPNPSGSCPDTSFFQELETPL